VITFEDIMRTMQDQMLTTLTDLQQGSIEAYLAWVKATSHMLPDFNLYHEMPTFMQDMLGDPEAMVENYYDFAIKVMHLQKEWVHEIFQASMMAPQTPHLPRYGVETRTPRAS